MRLPPAAFALPRATRGAAGQLGPPQRLYIPVADGPPAPAVQDLRPPAGRRDAGGAAARQPAVAEPGARGPTEGARELHFLRRVAITVLLITTTHLLI